MKLSTGEATIYADSPMSRKMSVGSAHCSKIQCRRAVSAI
jgi:hypothetical protein